MYTGEADWRLIGEVKRNPRMAIPIIGNGDVTSAEICARRFEEYGVDGVMIGRASIGRPWVFREVKHYLRTGESLPSESFGWYLNILKRQDMTVFTSVHDLNIASLYCDRIVVLKKGDLVKIGTPEEVITPEMIHYLYGIDSEVRINKTTGRPQIQFLPNFNV